MNDKPTNTTIVSIDDDRGLGLALFLVFIVACLLVIDAVALLALVPAWWVLGFAFGVHALMTGAVLLAVFNALSGGALGLGGGVDKQGAGVGQEGAVIHELEPPARAPSERRHAYPAAA
jgi:hypothetical protein